jgi:hypothetical protein
MSGENGNIDLNHAEILRYSRHLLIPEVGLTGQKKIKAASVLVIGTGGLGSPGALVWWITTWWIHPTSSAR